MERLGLFVSALKNNQIKINKIFLVIVSASYIDTPVGGNKWLLVS